MKTIRTSLTTAIIAILSTQILFASTIEDNKKETDSTDSFGVSVNLSDSGRSFGSFGLGLNYRLPYLESGISIASEINNSSKNNPSWTDIQIGAYVGYRLELKDMIYGSLGAQGNYLIISNKGNYLGGRGINNNPYTIGPYIGLSYEPTSNIAIFVRMNIFSYQSNGYDSNSDINASRSNEWGFFNFGVIGMGYYF